MPTSALDSALDTMSELQDEIDTSRLKIVENNQFIARLRREVADALNETKREERSIDRRLTKLKQVAQEI
tara:strand:+ start:7294 stop:7503 length:210 start_codon:yes stop_codon:yes gene_type:complete